MRLNEAGGSTQFPLKRESLMQPSVHSVINISMLLILILILILMLLLLLILILILRYAVKYNEQLILTLEEDEFSCKQRLAYKLEQVHNIMQGDAQ